MFYAKRIALVALLAAQISCMWHSYRVKLSGPVTLTDQWLEFNPNPYLRADKDWQEVGLELDEPFNDDFFSEGNGRTRVRVFSCPTRTL